MPALALAKEATIRKHGVNKVPRLLWWKCEQM